jgi:cell division protein FtsI/penicillin-binding protein 2
MAKEKLNFFARIILWIRLFLIRRAMKRVDRERKVVSYAGATHIGVLCEPDRDDNTDFLNRFINKLKADNKKVTAIGYYSKKRMPDVSTLPQITQWFTRKDFSLFLRPQRVELQEYAKRRFDILIDLTTAGNYPMKYIAAISSASYKTGAHNSNYLNIFDFVIQVKEDCPASDFAEHIIHYLKIIKTPGE